MNKEKILEVAGIMEKRGKVNMGSYFENVSRKGSCATPGCIAGTTAAMEGWKPIGCQTMVYHKEDPSTVRPVQKVAAEILGLDDGLAKRLFFRDLIRSPITKRSPPVKSRRFFGCSPRRAM